ncbi:hypothetical protein D3C87_1076720 [compost metagenome]
MLTFFGEDVVGETALEQLFAQNDAGLFKDLASCTGTDGLTELQMTTRDRVASSAVTAFTLT